MDGVGSVRVRGRCRVGLRLGSGWGTLRCK